MNDKTIIHKESVAFAAIPPTQPAAPVTKMLLECTQTGGNTGVDGMVTTAYVNLDAKNQQVRQVGAGTEDQDVVVLSQLDGYLQKGAKSIAGLFLSTSGGMMVGDINMGTNQQNTIRGLPSSWGEASFLGNDYAASVGIVNDVLGNYEDRLNDLIAKINMYAGTGEGSMAKLITDLGSPKETTSGSTTTITFDKPEEAKWLLLSAKNAMTGTLRFEQQQGALPTAAAPTIKNLKTGDIGVVGTATPKEKLQKIVTVSDLTTILNDLQNNSSGGSGSGTGSTTTPTFPNWTGQEVPYFVEQNPNGTSGSGTQSPIKSTNADKYIKKENSTYSLLRRGVYLVTFAYEFTSSQNQAVTCTGTLTEKTTGGTGSNPETLFSVVGSSDGLTVVGSFYILVPGEKAFSEHTLELKLTTGTAGTAATASKSYVAISYMGAGY
ncbi:hypothetical protein C6H88_01650 [Chlamydia muridarum str. Nigg]|uniref:Uncharacterized protein n=2 Tax=Chlamydia muridarum TaxID=83560 RepID=A0A070A0M2_CHLMR|nr:hypothetical protein [Chlamydia muridarum]UFW32863.1 hypothetical protein FTM91_01735 [Chlamydia trachomatis]AAF39184.1 hypothetical protein TC_0319 [Chlamydia muridarum str. Nigg]AHH22709.1 hypothetical protein TAC_01670 [Chlamydia muridarum str. Nigg3 CMUT3-5]AHH23633.1 hypothetical protein Y015_01670 [Chlamydia muridarum str. Nigg CM972]AID37852.1 hypothetical protein BB17_01705 [Chlamydia muridarum str. Nigg 2 MCR]